MFSSFTVNFLSACIFCAACVPVFAEENNTKNLLELERVKPPSALGLEIIIDPASGEMTSETNIPSEQDTPDKAAQNVESKLPDVKMTEMANGATKIDFNGRFIRPLSAALDDSGALQSHGHSELSEQGAK